MDLKWEAFNLLRFAQNFREEVQQSEGSIAFPTVSFQRSLLMLLAYAVP